MKTQRIDMQNRKYRLSVNNTYSYYAIVYMQSDILIGIPSAKYSQTIANESYDFLLSLHADLQNTANRFPDFFTSYKPLFINESVANVCELMVQSAEQANVGPMAAVAGAIAQCIGKYLLTNFNVTNVIIENGGDLFIHKQNRKITVDLFVGNTAKIKNITVQINDFDQLGISTSSGLFGTSFSYGKADLVTIICENAALADAYATAFCNQIELASDIPLVIEKIQRIKNIAAGIIVKDNMIAFTGNVSIIKIEKSKL